MGEHALFCLWGGEAFGWDDFASHDRDAESAGGEAVVGGCGALKPLALLARAQACDGLVVFPREVFVSLFRGDASAHIGVVGENGAVYSCGIMGRLVAILGNARRVVAALVLHAGEKKLFLERIFAVDEPVADDEGK